MFDEKAIERINKRGENTMMEHLGIEIVEIGEQYIKGKMPVDHRTHQPLGFLHGGANVVLAETLGSIAANEMVDNSKQYVVGLEINANHIKSVTRGFVYGVTKPIHLGKKTHVWEIMISDEEGDLLCISRFTIAVIDRK